MTSQDICTSGTSRVLTVASLQRLKMEALIPAPTECEVQFLIKFLNAQSIASIEIYQLCQIYGHTRLDGQHISCRSSVGRCLNIIHPIARTSRPLISTFSSTSRNFCLVSVSFSEWQERRRWASQWFQSQAAEFYDTGYKSRSHGMINVSISEMNIKIAKQLHLSQ